MKCKLSDVVSILGDGLHGTPKYDEKGDHYFINGNNLCEGKIVIKPDTKRVSYDEYLKHSKNLTDRTIFVSINGTLGNVAVYNGEKVVLGKSACYFNVKNDVDKNFIYYVVNTAEFQDYITRYANGTTIKNVPLSAMRDYEFDIPPLAAQREIGRTLSTLDAKIAVNNAINHNLEQTARAIFAERFGDREPNGVLSDICRYNTDRIAVSELTNAIYLSTENMLPNGEGFVESSGLPSIEYTTSFAPGDVLISNIRPYFKKIVYPDFSGVCSTDVLCFRARTALYSQYLYSVLREDDFFAYVVAGSKGTKMPRGDKQQIMSYEVVVPHVDELVNFNNVCSPMFLTAQRNAYENRNLVGLRDELLPRLMSGESYTGGINDAV